MKRRVLASKLIFALGIALLWAGCSERMSFDVVKETDDPTYRRAKDLLARNLSSEALSNFNNLIMTRNGNAPESHLEAGLIYLNHFDDPVSAYYHFSRHKIIKEREPQSATRDEGLARVDELIKTAKKELLTNIDAQDFRKNLLDTIENLRAENEALKQQLANAGQGRTRNASPSERTESPGIVLSEPPTPQRPGTTTQRRTYTVQGGDSLYRISGKMYGDSSRWEEILAANRAILSSEADLQPGMQLIIP